MAQRRASIQVAYSGKEPPLRYSRLHYDPIIAGTIDGLGSEPHDKAIIRAYSAHYAPQNDKNILGDPYSTLFVARLHPRTGESTLESFFGAFGPIAHLRLVRDVATGASKRYAFITFEHWRDFFSAWRQTNKAMLDGAQILVEQERERITEGWVPRRLGGGIGGRKESGQLRFGGRGRPFQAVPFHIKSRFVSLEAGISFLRVNVVKSVKKILTGGFISGDSLTGFDKDSDTIEPGRRKIPKEGAVLLGR